MVADVFNIFQPGASAAVVDTLLSIAKAKTADTCKHMKRVTMHSETVGGSKHKNETNQPILEVSSSITEINKHFPKAEIAFSSTTAHIPIKSHLKRHLKNPLNLTAFSKILPMKILLKEH